VLIPIPSKDFDPTEVAVSWKVLKRLRHSVVFATPAGREGSADDIMLTGEGLDLWGFLPGLRRLVAFGGMARANADARRAYTEMRLDPAFKAPLAWRQLSVEGFDGLLLPGGHHAGECANTSKAMSCRRWSPTLRPFAGGGDLPWRFARRAQRRADGGRSVLFGRRTTCAHLGA
jgi:hypothetical protein